MLPQIGFSEGIGKKVGNGLLTSFWFDQWVRDTPLRGKVLKQRHSKVGEIGTWVDVEWVWDLKCRRELFVWEADLRDELMRALNSMQISNAQDIWFWKHDSNGI
ncbi:putative ribonuclease H protein, partial [Trifolium medium]|nr:putative ribonuclease H protein [Trifolium medium]